MSSRPEQQLSNVVLPEPEGPITETNSPSCTTRSTSRSASTSSAPVWYVLRTRSAMSRASTDSVTSSPSAAGAATSNRKWKSVVLSHPYPAQGLGQLLRAARSKRRHGLRDITDLLLLPLDRGTARLAQDEPASVLGLDRHRLGHRALLDVDRHALGARIQGP